VVRWTQKAIKEVAREERAALGLGPLDPFDPYTLAAEHGIAVYTVSSLRNTGLSGEAHDHFSFDSAATWSAALVPFGTARVIIDNDAHALTRRRASVAHELGHHLLEHPFDGALLGANDERVFDPSHEKQADIIAGELLIPEKGAIAAAFARMDNVAVGAKYGVSPQFAQLQMKGPRVIAERSVARRGA
jgi:hypothetical protein